MKKVLVLSTQDLAFVGRVQPNQPLLKRLLIELDSEEPRVTGTINTRMMRVEVGRVTHRALSFDGHSSKLRH